SLVPARTGIGRGDQRETRGELDGTGSPGDHHSTVLEWLAQTLDGGAMELGELVQNSTPWWASETSPGRRYEPPPPSKPASEMEWWGDLKGRAERSPALPSRPAIECSCVTSSASARERAGRMVASRRASMVLPAPGEPTIRTLCPPAAATSSARRACACPRTSAKSTSGSCC